MWLWFLFIFHHFVLLYESVIIIYLPLERGCWNIWCFCCFCSRDNKDHPMSAAYSVFKAVIRCISDWPWLWWLWKWSVSVWVFLYQRPQWLIDVSLQVLWLISISSGKTLKNSLYVSIKVSPSNSVFQKPRVFSIMRQRGTEMRVKGSYFTSTRIKMTAVHPHKDSRYYQTVSQWERRQSDFSSKMNAGHGILWEVSVHVGQKNISHCMPLKYIQRHLQPDLSPCWCWEGVTESSCHKANPSHGQI